MLCHNCLNFLVNTPPSPRPASDQLKSFESCSSASQPCYLCDIIRQRVKDPRSDEIPRISLTTSLNEDRCDVDLSVVYKYRKLVDIRTLLLRRRLETPISITPWPSLTNTADKSSFEIAHRWLSNCKEGHQKCQMRSEETIFCPVRLLRVAGSLTSPQIHLYLTATEMPAVPYLTLSHRWGKGGFLIATTDNLQSLTQGIEYNQLPKTFQDAVTATIRLGYEFIWVDSLCILQDSSTDWNQHAQEMAKIYRNADCNLSALNATSADSGLFFDRKSIDPVTFNPTWAKSSTFEILENDAEIWKDVGKAPLTRRGWVFQERILSRRIIHFGKQQLLWECGHLCAQERNPNEIRYRFTGIHYDPLNKMVDSSLKGGHVDVWYRAVSRYSQCDLTNPMDKLPAIAGIAAHIAHARKDKYLCGMWVDSLMHFITWDVGRVSKQPSRVKPKRAPSWSWASVEGRIHCEPVRPKDYHTVCSLEHIHYTTDSATTELQRDEYEFPVLQLKAPIYRASIIPRSNRLQINDLHGRTLHPHDSIKAKFYPDDKKDLPQSEIFCFIVHVSISDEIGWSLNFKGVVIRPLQTRNPEGSEWPIYERIGVFVHNQQPHIRDNEEESKEVLEGGANANDLKAEERNALKRMAQERNEKEASRRLRSQVENALRQIFLLV